jgi:anti-sigma regulatory factor (Ser/Thr protein kinase)
MTLELQATPEEVMRAVEALHTFARAQQVSEKIIFELALAMEECGSNIVNHALQRDAHQTIRVTIGRDGDVLFVEWRDRGPEFDPTAAPQSGSQKSADDLPGGWGIQLARHYTDEFRYHREAGENILRLGKRLSRPNFNSPNQTN